MFNRILQRRKYLCRSRALHIGLNLGVIEEWISGSVGVGLPREVGGHFKVVRELIGWLQVSFGRFLLAGWTDVADSLALVSILDRSVCQPHRYRPDIPTPQPSADETRRQGI